MKHLFLLTLNSSVGSFFSDICLRTPIFSKLLQYCRVRLSSSWSLRVYPFALRVDVNHFNSTWPEIRIKKVCFMFNTILYLKWMYCFLHYILTTGISLSRHNLSFKNTALFRFSLLEKLLQHRFIWRPLTALPRENSIK